MDLLGFQSHPLELKGVEDRVEVQLFSALNGFAFKVFTEDGSGFSLQCNDNAIMLYRLAKGVPTLAWSK